MNSGKWKITGYAVYRDGSYNVGRDGSWTAVDSVADLYRTVLKTTPVKIKKYEKFFRIGEQSALTIVMALLAIQQTELSNLSEFDKTAILGYGNDGSHQGNLTYWNDFAGNGKISAQGHLFVGTLASTPLCQLSLILGCHAPVYYVSPSAGRASLAAELDFLHDQCRNLFLIELKHDYCSCLFLQAEEMGESSENVITSLGDFE